MLSCGSYSSLYFHVIRSLCRFGLIRKIGYFKRPIESYPFFPYESIFKGFDDVYGHSYDEGEFGVSPGTAGQFLFNRDKSNVTFASVMGAKESIEEEPDNLDAVISRYNM